MDLYENDGRITKAIRVEDARLSLQIRFPVVWVREKNVGDLLELVAKTMRSRSLPAEWYFASALSLENCEPQEPLCEVLKSQQALHVRWRASWRCAVNSFVRKVPPDALRLALHFAGSDPERYRLVCSRFREEAGIIVRDVRCGSGQDVRSLCRAFPRCETLVVSGLQPFLVDAAAYWSRLVALDVSGVLEYSDVNFAVLLRRIVMDAPGLLVMDVSRTHFGDQAYKHLPKSITALDVSWTHLSATPRKPYLAARSCRFRPTQICHEDTVLLAIDVVPLWFGPSLRWLSISGCNDLFDNHVSPLRDIPLLGLDLQGCTELSDTAIALLFGDSPPLASSIIDLSLRACDHLTDHSLFVLAENATSLVVVDMELLWRLTADGVAALAISARHLTHLYLRGAGNVNRRALTQSLRDGDHHIEPIFTPRHTKKRPSWPHRPLHDLFFTPGGTVKCRRPMLCHYGKAGE